MNDLARLVAEGVVKAAPSPLPPAEDGAAVEVHRCIGSGGITTLGRRPVLADSSLAVRLDPAQLVAWPS